MTKMKVAVIGAGPAGMFCAYQLGKLGAEVTVIERGPSSEMRHCPDINCNACTKNLNCEMLCGEGGAGGFSDGKITLSPGS